MIYIKNINVKNLSDLNKIKKKNIYIYGSGRQNIKIFKHNGTKNNT